MTLLSARLRHRITFEAQIVEQDSDGETVVTWGTADAGSDYDLEDVPAEVLTGPGMEVRAADTKLGEIVARITVRWFPGFDPSWRVVHGDRIYNVAAHSEDAAAGRWLRLECSAGLNDGQ